LPLVLYSIQEKPKNARLTTGYYDYQICETARKSYKTLEVCMQFLASWPQEELELGKPITFERSLRPQTKQMNSNLLRQKMRCFAYHATQPK